MVYGTDLPLQPREPWGDRRVKTEAGLQAWIEFEREFFRVQSEGGKRFLEAAAVHSYLYLYMCIDMCMYIYVHALYMCVHMN